MAKHLTSLGLGSDEIPRQEPKEKPAAKGGGVSRKRTIVILVIVVVLAAYAFALGHSYLAIQDGMNEVNTQYAALMDDAKQADYAGVIDSSHKMTRAMDRIQEQTELWIWGIPARIPVIGDDVRMARTLAAVGQHACDDALIPACDRMEKVIPTDGSDWGSAKDLSRLLDQVEDSQKITEDCERQIDKAGDAHFARLNKSRDNLKSVLKGINDTYASLHDELTVIKSASDLMSLISG